MGGSVAVQFFIKGVAAYQLVYLSGRVERVGFGVDSCFNSFLAASKEQGGT
jgi:hypothetical protein